MSFAHGRGVGTRCRTLWASAAALAVVAGCDGSPKPATATELDIQVVATDDETTGVVQLELRLQIGGNVWMVSDPGAPGEPFTVGTRSVFIGFDTPVSGPGDITVAALGAGGQRLGNGRW